MPPVPPPLSTATPDPVLETQMFWVKYRSQILLGLAGLILAGVVSGGYFLYVGRRDAAAAALLTQAKGAPDYQKIISDYPTAGAAASAYLLLGEAQRKDGKFAEANATLKDFTEKNPKHELVTTAKMAMAGNLESLGKADDALEMYRRIAAENSRSYTAPFALLAEVHLLKQKGQTDEARRVCETVMTQYRESYASTEASRYLRMLKPPTTTATAVPINPPAAAATP